jgi:hypothetical protein
MGINTFNTNFGTRLVINPYLEQWDVAEQFDVCESREMAELLQTLPASDWAVLEAQLLELREVSAHRLRHVVTLRQHGQGHIQHVQHLGGRGGR